MLYIMNNLLFTIYFFVQCSELRNRFWKRHSIEILKAYEIQGKYVNPCVLERLYIYNDFLFVTRVRN